jgi:hypothetical protein
MPVTTGVAPCLYRFCIGSRCLGVAWADMPPHTLAALTHIWIVCRCADAQPAMDHRVALSAIGDALQRAQMSERRSCHA